MKRVEIRLNLEVVAPLLDLIKATADGLRPVLAIEAHTPEHEAELAAEWKRELLEAQTDDIGRTLALFDTDFFINGVLVLDAGNCEPILRACSALRLRLRATHLRAVADDALESGAITDEPGTPERDAAYAAYVFLATLQEVVVQHLDPTDPE